MENPTLTDELAILRNLLERLETGALTMRRSHEDVTQQEASILRKEIAALEKTLAQLKASS
jgi:methyltransferase-like protein